MKLILFILITIVAIASTLCGLLLISDPDGSILGLSGDLLQNTPFHNFLFPGLILTVVVGAPNLLAIFYHIERSPKYPFVSVAAGAALTAFTIAKMILIPLPHWLHYVSLGTGSLIILIALQLKGKWVV